MAFDSRGSGWCAGRMVVRPAPVLGACALAFAAAVFGAAESGRDPWELGLAFETAASHDAFAALHGAEPDSPRVRLGLACALLAREPRTQGNVLRADALLAGVGAGATRDERVLARFLRARIAQGHARPADPAAAERLFAALLADEAGHPVAEQGGVKLLLLQTTRPGTPPAEAIAEAEATLARLTHPDARRNGHEVLARAHLRAGSAADALRHWRAVRAIGSRNAARDALADLRIAELARELGDRALAVRRYRAFADARPRDNRLGTIRALVADLEAAP